MVKEIHGAPHEIEEPKVQGIRTKYHSTGASQRSQ